MSTSTVVYCPGCDGRIVPGQDVVGVDDPDPHRSLWHRVCRKTWEYDQRLAEKMDKAISTVADRDHIYALLSGILGALAAVHAVKETP